MIQEFIAALQNKETEKAKDLVRQNPSLAAAQADNAVPITMMAAYYRNMDLFNFLLDHKITISIFEAIIADKKETVANFIKEESVLHEPTSDGFSPLGIACFFGRADIVRLLVKKGANVNQASNNAMKVAPLHSAVAIQNLEIVQFLLDNGAEINAAQESGVTALHSAAHHGNKAMVKLLLKHGADKNTSMKNGKTPLDFAKEDGHKDIVQLLQK